ncbi:hypothetical protein FSP39_004825 [Pinctada imbricata]|uniref:Methyltransferase FkbM domain-containing protein n=1 Tax=Pinctada imbricata TaxID=66713 RepID=A0AA88XDM4_PINIB|nr:hypothetical protein FSP39_004825 [Pinctada imbricata]
MESIRRNDIGKNVRIFVVVTVISFGFMFVIYGTYVSSFKMLSERFGYSNSTKFSVNGLEHLEMERKAQFPGHAKTPKMKVPAVWTYAPSEMRESGGACEEMDKIVVNADFVKSFIRNIPIFIHNPRRDYISSQINSNHDHEPHIFNIISSFLAKDRDMNLIDIGANIGVISLKAAMFGRKVISVEAAVSNVQHICASANINRVTKRITVIHNAISDNHTSVTFVMGKDGEFGGSFMDDGNFRDYKTRKSGVKFDTQNLVTIKTIILDDLLLLPNINDFKSVFIKMDIEGSEHKALLGAKKLFRMINVRGVLMEWRWHVERPESKSIILEFMEENGFEPYALAKLAKKKLDGKTMRDSDVLWLPKSL